jgi:hypothetical protein
MAIAAPCTVVAEYAQDLTVTVTLSTPTNVSGWTATATLRAYHGGTALATKTIGSGITVSDSANGVFVVSFSAADLTQAPGAYVWELYRTNVGFVFPIVDPSAFIIRPSNASAYPTLTNLAEYVTHALNGATITDNQARHLIQLLAASEDQIKRFCNRDFVYKAAGTEYCDARGTFDIQVARWPILPADVTVYEDWTGNYGQTSGAFDPTTTLLTRGTDYVVPVTRTWGDGQNHTGLLKRLGRTWPYRTVRPRGHLTAHADTLGGCVKVVYSGGYQLMPYSLKRAVWDLTTQTSEMSTFGRIANSESGEGYSVGYGDLGGSGGGMALPHTIQAALAPFVRYVVV